MADLGHLGRSAVGEVMSIQALSGIEQMA